MNPDNLCPSFAFEDLLNDDCDHNQRTAFEAHVESCESCQERLTNHAAGAGWWTKATTHLSTVEQIAMPEMIRSRLLNSGSFVIPTLIGNRDQADYSFHPMFDWRQILDPPTHPEMLGRIDQFEIEAKIGQGGMGLVLKGFDRHLNRAVAIKVLSPHLASNGTSRKRFAREAQAAAAVVHPNVIPIYAVKASETRPYIVMQLVSGHSLQSLVQEKGPLEVKEIVRIAIQVADGLSAAHQQGLIHRDIKPANVLIEQDVSRVMITDFGLARAADDAGMTQTGWIAGTPHYMSPEQASGEGLDCRSDLFSLGALMYFLATGREPFRAEKSYAVIQKIIREQPTSAVEINNELPLMISDIIEKLLEKKPQDRYQAATEVRDLLERYLSHLQQPRRVAKPNRVMTRRRRRFRAMAIASIACLALIIATGFALYNLGNPFLTKSIGLPSNAATHPVIESTVNNELNLPGFFSSDQFEAELSTLSRDIELFEKSLRQTSPLDQGAGISPNHSPLLYPGELEQLQTTISELQEHQGQQNESLKQLLKQSAIYREKPVPKPKQPERP